MSAHARLMAAPIIAKLTVYSGRNNTPTSPGPTLCEEISITLTRNERLTASVEGSFVVFLIGFRINQPWRVHKWLPVMRAMPRMIDELQRHPDSGFMHAQTWFARTTMMVQYWRSLEQLLSYATDKNAAHLPAWRAFNRSIGTDGSVGIWHETYAVSAGSYENIYVNMPVFGLGAAGRLQPATGARSAARDRLRVPSG